MKQFFNMKKVVAFVVAVFFALNAGCVFSLEEPVSMLKTVTGEIMTKLRENQEDIKLHPKKLYATVEHIAIPHVDFVEMGRWVVGRNAWRSASDATKDGFIHEFKILVVRSYARSLLEYLNYEIEFLPMRDSVDDKKRIEVLSLLKGEGRSLKMNYRLIDSKDRWRVFDIILENVSLVQGYRAQFANDIQRGGLKTVVETVRKKNEAFDLDHGDEHKHD